MSRHDFEKLLLEAVDEELTTLGESSKQALYFHLERGFKIKKHEIPYKPEAFADAIEKIFGMGADFLEILIMKRLYAKIGHRVKLNTSENLTFTEYIVAAKRSFHQSRNAENNRELVQCKQRGMEG